MTTYPKPQNQGKGKSIGLSLLVIAALAAIAVSAYVIGYDKGKPNEAAKQSSPSPSGGGGGDDAKQAFVTSCGSCHILAAAGTTGNLGPNLDDLKPDQALVEAQIKSGGGAMPANLLQGEQAVAVSKYVADNAGK